MKQTGDKIRPSCKPSIQLMVFKINMRIETSIFAYQKDVNKFSDYTIKIVYNYYAIHIRDILSISNGKTTNIRKYL